MYHTLTIPGGNFGEGKSIKINNTADLIHLVHEGKLTEFLTDQFDVLHKFFPMILVHRFFQLPPPKWHNSNCTHKIIRFKFAFLNSPPVIFLWRKKLQKMIDYILGSPFLSNPHTCTGMHSSSRGEILAARAFFT